MQSQLSRGSRLQASRLNWLPQRSCVLRRTVSIHATSGAAPPVKELSKDIVTRQYRRTVYDFALWTKHRDVGRYLYNLKTIPGSRIIRQLSQPMGIVLAWAALFGLYEQCLESGVLPSYLPKLTLMSAEPQGLTSFALSLLLVFRTNSSYGRFDEARKIWGGILNRARNIANQAVTFVPSDDAAGREAVGKWTVGFCRALQAHLQEDADLRAELQKAQPRWTQEEIDILCNAQHRPIKAISMLSELTRQLSITEFQALQMQENVTFFYDALGGCERLLRTPIPVSYTRHTARFLTIWLSLLPLGLWERYHWSMLPVIALIGFLLLGIDEIGITIEEPFGILPLDAICTRAQTDVVSLIKDDPAVSKYIAEVRDGRIKAPAEPVAALPAAAPAAATPAVPAVVPSAIIGPPASNRSGSPSPQQPGVMRTVTSMFSNVKAGVGAVAPGAPPQAPRPPSPKTRSASPRSDSPSKPNPFPPASAGTGRTPPRPVAATLVPAEVTPAGPVLNGTATAGAKPKAAAGGPFVAGTGFTMSFSGLADGAAAAAARLTKLADSMTGGDAAAPKATEADAAAVPAKAVNLEVSRSPSPPAASPASSSSAIEADADVGDSGSSRRAANWREELAALRASRAREEEEEDAGASSGAGSEEDGPLSSSSAFRNGGQDDSDDEALRRFGSLAGRSRSAAASSNGGHDANGNGHSNGDGNGKSASATGENVEASRSARPRTRPDWRNQL